MGPAWKRFGFILIVSCAAISCTVETTKSGSGGGSPTTSETAGSPLYIEVSTSYGSDSNTSVTWGSCYIDPTTAITTKACDVRVPELVLFHSKVTFKIGTTGTSSCEHVAFSPYYFRRSSSATYAPFVGAAGGDLVDCSDSDEQKCWGGVAAAIVGAGFPKSRGVYFLPKVVESQSYTVDSVNDRRMADAASDRSFKTNVNVANNLATGARATPINNANLEYEATEFQDYEVTCFDKWFETKYNLTLTLGDDDTDDTPSSTDQKYDWGD